jgi:hypothetical protein
LGVFLDEYLSGIADLLFGIPELGDAYVELMMLGPWARNQGIGQILSLTLGRTRKKNWRS